MPTKISGGNTIYRLALRDRGSPQTFIVGKTDRS